jgi:hypothetical protein
MISAACARSNRRILYVSNVYKKYCISYEIISDVEI